MYTANQTKGTVKAISQPRKLRSKSGQVARSGRDRKAWAQGVSPVFSEPTFVKQQFLPLISSVAEPLIDQKNVEQGFFNSLLHFCKAYNIEPRDFSDVPYPLNLRQYYLYLRSWLRAKYSDLTLHIISGDTDVATLNTVRTFDTGRTLYYIPVEPLHKLMAIAERKATADLLTAVFAYLHGVVRVDHFAERETYLYYVYTVLKDWAEESDDEDYTDLRERFDEIETAGEWNLTVISDDMHLLSFEQRIKSFVPVSPADHELLKIATGFYALYTAYPERSIYDRILELHDVDDHEYGVVRLGTYLSFYWSGWGIEYDQMIDYVNTDLQECTLMDEPSIAHYFDKPIELTDENFDFEKRLFDLIDELCDNLKDLDHECYAKN